MTGISSRSGPCAQTRQWRETALHTAGRLAYSGPAEVKRWRPCKNLDPGLSESFSAQRPLPCKTGLPMARRVQLSGAGTTIPPRSGFLRMWTKSKFTTVASRLTMLPCNCGSVGKKRGSFPDTARPVSTWATVLSQIVTAQLFTTRTSPSSSLWDLLAR